MYKHKAHGKIEVEIRKPVRKVVETEIVKCPKCTCKKCER